MTTMRTFECSAVKINVEKNEEVKTSNKILPMPNRL